MKIMFSTIRKNVFLTYPDQNAIAMDRAMANTALWLQNVDYTESDAERGRLLIAAHFSGSLQVLNYGKRM